MLVCHRYVVVKCINIVFMRRNLRNHIVNRNKKPNRQRDTILNNFCSYNKLTIERVSVIFVDWFFNRFIFYAQLFFWLTSFFVVDDILLSCTYLYYCQDTCRLSDHYKRIKSFRDVTPFFCISSSQICSLMTHLIYVSQFMYSRITMNG